MTRGGLRKKLYTGKLRADFSFFSFGRHLNSDLPHERILSRLIGNGTVGAAELTSQLGVTEAPAFFVYRRGGEMITSWKGRKRLETGRSNSSDPC